MLTDTMKNKPNTIPKEPKAVRLERLLYAQRLKGSSVPDKTKYSRKNKRTGIDASPFSLLVQALRGLLVLLGFLWLLGFGTDRFLRRDDGDPGLPHHLEAGRHL